jgi:hypothetical protein
MRGSEAEEDAIDAVGGGGDLLRRGLLGRQHSSQKKEQSIVSVDGSHGDRRMVGFVALGEPVLSLRFRINTRFTNY